MIEGLKPYPDYKESSQSWLGQIPASWDSHALSSCFAKSTNDLGQARKNCSRSLTKRGSHRAAKKRSRCFLPSPTSVTKSVAHMIW